MIQRHNHHSQLHLASDEAGAGHSANHRSASDDGCHVTDTSPTGSTADASVTGSTGVDSANHTADAGSTSGTTDVTATTDLSATNQTGDTAHTGSSTADASVTGSTGVDSANHTADAGSTTDASAAADAGHHLSDDAFAFPAHDTSAAGSDSGAASGLFSDAHFMDSLSGLSSDLAAIVHDVQAYVGEHHFTATDAHKLVDDIHAKIASSLDFHC